MPIAIGPLNRYTVQVRQNNRTIGAGESPTALPQVAVPVPPDLAHASPIQHVIYIIKENRTYDQVFCDLAKGIGDPSLTIFGRAVTPNIHALAEQFVLLDNYYTAGDQSALGHQWCDEAYANDYVHKYGNAPEDLLKRAIWHSVRGYDTPYPEIRQAGCQPALRKPGAGRLVH